MLHRVRLSHLRVLQRYFAAYSQNGFLLPAISLNHSYVDGKPVGVHHWVVSFCVVPGSYAPIGKGCSSVGHAIGPAGIEQVTLLSNGRDESEIYYISDNYCLSGNGLSNRQVCE